MTGALIILAVTIAIGVILWGWEKYRTRRHGPSLHHHHRQPQSTSQATETAEATDLHDAPDATAPQNSPRASQETAICCGLHSICEKTGQINEPPIYYDDEELDRFAGRASDGYTDEETEEFRDVLLTLLPSDAPGWAVSLEKRRINLPADLLPELELMLSEA